MSYDYSSYQGPVSREHHELHSVQSSSAGKSKIELALESWAIRQRLRELETNKLQNFVDGKDKNYDYSGREKVSVFLKRISGGVRG